MRPGIRSMIWLSCLTGTVACAGDGGGGTMTVSDSAGVTTVSNVDEGLWGEGDAWTVEEDLRIGVLEGDPEYQFGRIAWMTAGADGSIYVLDEQAQHVQRFDADGRYVRTIGRPGAGPGELGEASTFVGLAGGETLVVSDLDNERLSLFTTDGEAVGTVPLTPEQGLPVTWRSTASGVVARQVRPLPDPVLRSAADTLDALVTLAEDGTDADTLMKVPSGGTLTVRNDNPNLEVFAAEPIWTLTDDLNVLYGMSDAYRIGIYESGSLTRVFSKVFTPVRVTDADRRAVMQGLLGAFGGDVPQGALDQLSSLIRFHETFPVIAAVTVGPEGTYWVQRTRPAGEIVGLIEPNLRSLALLQRMGGPRWDVFDSQGRFLGPVQLPDRFIPRLFRDDLVYGVWQDELGVDYVMRLRIVRGA